MSDKCASTILCSSVDLEVFERLGYRLEDEMARDLDGGEIPGAVVMLDDKAPGGHYDELIGMKGIAFVVRNSACSGVWGDHLMASDAHELAYAEALHESNYPAVRVSSDGEVLKDDLDAARSYWQVYANAIEAIKGKAEQIVPQGRDLDEVDFKS
jgi:hypothetical protein